MIFDDILSVRGSLGGARRLLAACSVMGMGVIGLLGGDTKPLADNFPKLTQLDKGWLEGVEENRLLDYRPMYDAMAKRTVAGEGGHSFIVLQSSHLKMGNGDLRWNATFNYVPMLDREGSRFAAPGTLR